MCNYNCENIKEIYERNVTTVFRICYSYLKNIQDSEDAVSAVFIKLMNRNIIFTCPEDEKKWLIVVACNHCKSQLRFNKKHRRIDIQELPEQEYWNNSENSELLDLILSMSEKYKNVLYLHYYEGYSLKEIAKMTDSKESTVRSRLFYGKKKLLKLLGDDTNEKIFGINESYLSGSGTKRENL